MKPRTSGRAARYAAGGVAALLLTPTSSAAPSEVVLPSLADLVASAHARTGEPVARDEANQAITLLGMNARADAVATASATCTGCRARAVAVQIVRARWAWRVRADNVATSWTSCRECSSEVVSVQLVLTPKVAALSVNNRALAATAGCDRCAANAVAYQLVVQASPAADELPGLRDALAAWARRQPAPVGAELPAGSPSVRRQTRPGLADLEREVTDAIGGTVLRSRMAAGTD
jgi:hypothetical protein